MPTYLELAVNVPQVTEVFHYHLPPNLEGRVSSGHLVEAPFGGQRVQGVVLRFVEQPAVSETKPVLSLVDEQAVVTPAQIELALHLAQSTLTPLPAWITLMLPAGLGQQADTLYSLSTEGFAGSGQKLSNLQRRIVELLQERGPLRGRQIDQALPRANWRAAARSLVHKRLLSAQSVLPHPSVQPKIVRTVALACSPETALTMLPNLGRPGGEALARRQAIVQYLLKEPGPTNVAWVYAASRGTANDLRKLAELGLIKLNEAETWRDPLEGQEFVAVEPPTLTKDQQVCWREIQRLMQATQNGNIVPPVLLHGVTGSGKTELYLRAVEETLRQGRQAIVLVPEIALTPQTIRRFLARFPGQVGLAHSQLSAGERYDTWRRARAGQLGVVVGPRSALFTPFPNPGLVVIDECHDESYYQSEPPFYDARQVAIIYTRLIKGMCILGSATPDISHRYQAERGHWHYLLLPNRILAHRQAVQAQAEKLGLTPHYTPLEAEAMTISLPQVWVVDMRHELKAGNRSIFSRALQIALERVLENEQQAILFLNRRGTATYIFCRECGLVLKCPRCDLPLTYHIQPHQDNQLTQQIGELVCHHCGYRRKIPKTCPQCGSERIRQFGTGTEKVEAEVQALFPNARTLRWDYETTRQKGAHELILSQFSSHRADVLVGTQMLAKGLDLPYVTLVGVVLADVGLNLPDFRASERTFQVLTQVAGRAGRSPLGGEVILQTFQPDHYVIQAAASHDYPGFYRQELAYRKQLGYPPFLGLARLEYRHTDPQRAASAAQKMGEQVHKWLVEGDRRATETVGPVPCFFSRIAGYYRWQIVLRGPDLVSFLRARPFHDWRVELNPVSLL
jgi:primosomal protein N' (replication factor Y)